LKVPYDSDINALVRISRFAGRDVLLVQGGGGNTSVKSDDGKWMWIKASGYRLSEVDNGQGFIRIDLPEVLKTLRDPAIRSMPRSEAQNESVKRIQAACPDSDGLRPSLETVFHAVLGKVVLHTHPIQINAFTCMADGQKELSSLLGDAIWVPYVPPGFSLGMEVETALGVGGDIPGGTGDLVFLQNHGLTVHSVTAKAAIESTRQLIKLAETYFDPPDPSGLGRVSPSGKLKEWSSGLESALRERFSEESIQVMPASRMALMDAATRDPDRWLEGGALVPDDVVYGAHPVWMADETVDPGRWVDLKMDAFSGKMTIVVPGVGMVFASSSRKMLEAMEETMLAHVLVSRLVLSRGKPVYLPQEEVNFLMSMESEKYRQAIAGKAGIDG
jgi:rhamnose utilization protein RhaD (predicted bifunctional aldolase and dehydrogenase)